MKKIVLLCFVTLILFACGDRNEDENSPLVVIENMSIFTEKPLFQQDDTIFVALRYLSNYKSMSSRLVVRLNGVDAYQPVHTYDQLSKNEFEGYFLPVKQAGDYVIEAQIKNGKEVISYKKNIKILENRSLDTYWNSLSHNQVMSSFPLRELTNQGQTGGSGYYLQDMAFIGSYFKSPYTSPTLKNQIFIDGLFGAYFLIYNSQNQLEKIKIVNEPIYMVYVTYERIIEDIEREYGQPKSKLISQYNGYRTTNFETDKYQIKVIEKSPILVDTEITKK